MPRAWEPRKVKAPPPLEEPPPELPFTVERWIPGRLEPQVLGRTSDRAVAMAMFQAAAREHASGDVVLKYGDREVLRSHG